MFKLLSHANQKALSIGNQKKNIQLRLLYKLLKILKYVKKDVKIWAIVWLIRRVKKVLTVSALIRLFRILMHRKYVYIHKLRILIKRKFMKRYQVVKVQLFICILKVWKIPVYILQLKFQKMKQKITKIFSKIQT